MKAHRLTAAFLALVPISGPAAAAPWPPPMPGTLDLSVRETAGVARTAEVLRSGVPLPRSLAVTSTASLAVVDDAGLPVPAEFRVLARWNAGLSNSSAPIQWVLVAFPATVGANATATYRLVTNGSVTNPAPGAPLTVSVNGAQVTVATGAATFRLGGAASVPFDEVTRGGAPLVTGGALATTISGTPYSHSTTRSVTVEHQGPLSAVVTVQGAYDMPARGGGVLSSLRRYVFTAGSPTAVVRQVASWEGSDCFVQDYDTRSCGGNLNALRADRVRSTFLLAGAAPRDLTAVGAFASPAATATAGAGATASLRQLLRASRGAAQAFQMDLPGVATAGTTADGGMLTASTPGGTVAVALERMHRFEPQALRLLAEGSLAIDLVDDRAWIGNRQGLFATWALAALPASPARATLDREVWARLNAPLRAWPSAQWFSASEAVPEVPVGTLPPSLALYDQVVPAVLQRTRNEIRAKGLEGVMTFGSFPRQWGNPLYSDEIDCGGDDPTPGDDWDDPYWCATFTDYHSAASTPTIWAMRSGDVSWLPELATPAALRMLHTQIYQCGPGDATFYCGQAPNGYGGYRNNFNGSHAYFDNLLLHYWLTGDETIVRTLRRGATTMRAYVCPNPPCSATQPPADFWAQFTGRVAMQWAAVFRFLGLASDDATYLDDVRSLLARATTQNHVEAVSGGRTFGFMTYGGDLIGAAGTYDTDQLWMNALYDGQELYRFEVDTQNSSIGSPAIGVRTVRESLARTLAVYGPNLLGDGTAGTVWPNSLRFTFAGARIGGTLTSVVAPVPNPNCGLDECLYDTGKGALTASLVRAGQTANEPDVLAVGRGLTERVLGVAWNNGNPEPLGKNQGEYLVRTHAAVARLAWGEVQAQTGLGYFFIPPCRLVDTRDPAGPFGGPTLGASGERTFALAGRCGVPASAKAITANLTVLYPGAGGVLSAGRGDLPAPETTGVAFGGPGLVRASMLMIATTTDGSASVKVRNRSAAPADFVLDVSGYLE